MKLQIITLAAKLVVLSEDPTLLLLARYVFALARYDADYDLRDRARMLAALLAGVAPAVGGEDAPEVTGVVLRREQVRLVLFEGKGVTVEKDPWRSEPLITRRIDRKLIMGHSSSHRRRPSPARLAEHRNQQGNAWRPHLARLA